MKNNGRSSALSSTAPDMDTSNWTALLRVSGDYSLRLIGKSFNQPPHEFQVSIVVVIFVEESRASYNGGCGRNTFRIWSQ